VVRVLVVAEHDGARLSGATARCVSCALTLAPETLAVAVLAADGGAVAAAAARLAGVTRVIQIDRPENESQLASVGAPQIAALAREFTHVLAPSTTFGKDLLPRVAALLGVGQLSDVMGVDAPYRFRRPVYAGNAIVTVEAAADRVLAATVRTASYPPAGQQDSQAPIERRALDVDLPTHTRLIERRGSGGSRPELQTAARVVAGGRALGSEEGFKLVATLADRLSAAVGASRAAVDAGYAANDLQVGQTGKIIAPELYFAIGISGAIQHLTGIKDAGTIVAINKDPDAPIFEVADVAWVTDLFRAIPELLAALDADSA
jgi:electron transfer flavoprotein alpha subunit